MVIIYAPFECGVGHIDKTKKKVQTVSKNAGYVLLKQKYPGGLPLNIHGVLVQFLNFLT